MQFSTHLHHLRFCFCFFFNLCGSSAKRSLPSVTLGKEATLLSVWDVTLGKDLFVECNTQQRGIFDECPLFLSRASLVLDKVFAECPTKNTRQKNVCRLCVCRVLTFGKGFAECFWGSKLLFLVVRIFTSLLF